MLHEVWSLLEVENGRLTDMACKMASEARRTARIFSADACGLVFGSFPSETLEPLNWYGLKKLYFFESEPSLSPEDMARSIHTAASESNPLLILFAGTPSGAEVAARTAAALERGLVSNCIDFELDDGKPLARKLVYGGKAHAVYSWMIPAPYLATIDVSSLEDARDKSKSEPEVISLKIIERQSSTRLLRKWETGLTEMDLNEARIVIGIGKGVDAEFMDAINKLAGLINGVIGGTRIAVYSGLMPLERQIGTTGKWLDSDLYIAMGISGAPQHTMGIKEVKNTIAINLVKQAPIFKYTTLGIVGDLHQVVPELIALLEADLPEKK